MRAHVDRETCIGCGLCNATCEAVFSMDDEGISVAIADDVPEEDERATQEAADGCPVDAISIED